MYKLGFIGCGNMATAIIGGAVTSGFLKGDEIVEITSYEEEILGINLPAKVALTITECEPAVRGDTVNKAMKEALLETGLRVRVPLFIESGETILVRTDNAEYDGRA